MYESQYDTTQLVLWYTVPVLFLYTQFPMFTCLDLATILVLYRVLLDPTSQPCKETLRSLAFPNPPLRYPETAWTVSNLKS